LAKQNNGLIGLKKKLNEKLETTLEELYILKKEQEARTNRKRLAKRQPMDT
jgi:hypothetical protein